MKERQSIMRKYFINALPLTLAAMVVQAAGS